VAVRDIGWQLWIADTPRQRYFVKPVALIAKEKGVAEAFFDQITTAASNALERIAFGKEAAHAMTQADLTVLISEAALF